MMTAPEAAEAIQTLVVHCVKDGQLPAKLRDFSEMHDYIDANELLIEGIYGTEEFDPSSEAAANRDNAAMAIVNTWIIDGMPEGK